ncbi:hypothetical protein AYY19_15580 [Photobacterium aquimaris]|nr:hypothetical protein AYY20_19675 [Photobacterium aquimaris]OBU16548.1 hypothetical protein AYY19_15580 [Photobacterium aquimaris]PSW02753.1 hypothetical protein CTM91_00355 [Photobacterium aquimaris]
MLLYSNKSLILVMFDLVYHDFVVLLNVVYSRNSTKVLIFYAVKNPYAEYVTYAFGMCIDKYSFTS